MKNPIPVIPYAACIGGILLALPAAAQVRPDAGQILQQTRPMDAFPADRSPRVLIEEPDAEGPAGNQARIFVKAIRFTGNTAFAEETLAGQVQDSVNKDLSLSQLRQLATRVTRYYRGAGYWVALAYLPQQEVKDGIVEIAILEGRVGEVVVNNVAGLKANALAPLQNIGQGEVVGLDRLEASLLNLSDLPGVQVQSTLRPGKEVGTSDLVVGVSPGRTFAGSVDFNNYGNRYVGGNVAGAALYWGNPTDRGDLVSLNAQANAQGFVYGRLGYQVPFGTGATQLGVALSYMQYKLGKDFEVLDADGEARTGSIYLRHPFKRSTTANWYGFLQYEDKSLTDRIGLIGYSAKKTSRNVSARLEGEVVDTLGQSSGLPGASNRLTLAYSLGRIGLDDNAAAIDNLTARSQGRFGKWLLSLQRQQQLPNNFSVSVSYSAQLANKNLDSSEKMLLGGASAVRAYRQGEGLGDEAQLLKIDVKYALTRQWEAVAFYDDGRATVNHEPWDASPNKRHLAGYGTGISFTDSQYSFSAFAAWKTRTGDSAFDRDSSPRLGITGAFRF